MPKIWDRTTRHQTSLKMVPKPLDTLIRESLERSAEFGGFPAIGNCTVVSEDDIVLHAADKKTTALYGWFG